MPQDTSIAPTKSTTYSIFARVVSLKDDKVILRTEGNQEIIWPASKLPDNIKYGDELNLVATRSPILDTEQLDEEKTKRILEMMLNG